ncbi:MAG: tyrosine--tRNA ligase [Candidatus Anstonellales archaeon]
MRDDSSFISELRDKLVNPEMDLARLTAEQQFELIAAKAAVHPEAIIPKPYDGGSELLDLLKVSKETGKPLHVKFGIDPTGPNIHFGHAVSLLMLRRFQWMGHHIDLVFGDFTARIGDPSGRTTEREVLTDSVIKKNMSTYMEQASRILNLEESSGVKVWFNSEWLFGMTMDKWIPILLRISGSQLLAREDFTKRLKTGGFVSAAEMLYPLFMAYDSVVIRPDIELGGIDQLLNLHWCREVMKLYRQPSEVFILVDLLPGTSGEKDEEGQLVKMSKSKKNYVMVTEEPSEMYGKVMSIPDEIMWIWYRELTEISPQDLDRLKSLVAGGKFHPMEAKRLLARAIVGTFNHFDQDIIDSAERAFNQKFGKQKVLVPEDIEEKHAAIGDRIIDILSQITGESKSNIKKMTTQVGPSGIKILEGNEYRDINTGELLTRRIAKGESFVIKFGKCRYFRLIVE